MKKLFSILLILLALGGGYIGFSASHKLVPSRTQAIVLKPSSSHNNAQTVPTEIPKVIYGVPKTLSIPKINVNAVVESVGLDAQRAMDVPKGADNVGWYNLGVKPGDMGNSVMDGHLDKATGAPAVFWDVAKLEVGDKIIVTDVNGKDLTFKVTDKDKYPYDNFPLQKVFGSTDKHMLNLISCNGVWNTKTHNYSQRTVVYSQLVE